MQAEASSGEQWKGGALDLEEATVVRDWALSPPLPRETGPPL